MRFVYVCELEKFSKHNTKQNKTKMNKLYNIIIMNTQNLNKEQKVNVLCIYLTIFAQIRSFKSLSKCLDTLSATYRKYF